MNVAKGWCFYYKGYRNGWGKKYLISKHELSQQFYLVLPSTKLVNVSETQHQSKYRGAWSSSKIPCWKKDTLGGREGIGVTGLHGYLYFHLFCWALGAWLWWLYSLLQHWRSSFFLKELKKGGGNKTVALIMAWTGSVFLQSTGNMPQGTQKWFLIL